MSSCTGRGECLQQCGCICFKNEESNELAEVCTCGHRNHTHLIGGSNCYNLYCQTECPHNCKLVECHNYKMCGEKRPQQILDSHNGMCTNCAIMFGKINFLGILDDCPICMENKDMIQISCGKHNVCIDCWKHMSKLTNKYPLTCPMCRESIWKWKNR